MTYTVSSGTLNLTQLQLHSPLLHLSWFVEKWVWWHFTVSSFMRKLEGKCFLEATWMMQWWIQTLADLGGGVGHPPSPTVYNHTWRFGETRNRQIITIICFFVNYFVILHLSALTGRLWCFTVKQSSLQFIKFIASLLYGNLSLCCAVLTKSAKVIWSPASASWSVFVYFLKNC